MASNTENINNKYLTLNGRVFFYKDIIEDPLSLFELRSDFEIHTILFCKSWLRGESAFKINTSGSTGKPKEIHISREQMIKSIQMTAKAFHLVKGDAILVNLNSEYIAGMMMLARGLYLDLQIDIVEPSANPLLSMDKTHDFYAFVPMQLQTIIEAEKTGLLASAKAIIVGGAPITVYQEELFKKLPVAIYSTYGMTETCTHVAIRKLGETHFTTLNGVKINSDDRDCLIIESPTSIKNPLITNDVVEITSPTTFIWKGRYDNIINSGGIKIQLEEVEKKINITLSALNQPIQFILSSIPDPKLGEKLILIADKHFDVNSVELTLEKYEIPKEYHYISNFPLTETGKIDRKKLLIMV